MKDFFKCFDYSKYTMTELVNAYRNFIADANSLVNVMEDHIELINMYQLCIVQSKKIVREMFTRMNIEMKGE